MATVVVEAHTNTIQIQTPFKAEDNNDLWDFYQLHSDFVRLGRQSVNRPQL